MPPTGSSRLRPPLTHQAAYGIAGWALPLVVTLAVVPRVVRWLGSDGYGAYAVALAYIGVASAFTPARGIINQLASARTPGDRASAAKTGAVAAFATGLLCASLCAVLGIPLAHALGLDSGDLGTATLVMAGATALPAVVLSSSLGALQGLGRLDLVAASSITASVVSSLAVALAAALIGTAQAAVGAQFLATSCAAGIAAWLVASRVDMRAGRVSRAAARPLAGFSASVLAGQAVLSLWVLVERAVLGRTLGTAAVTAYVLPLMLGVYLQSAVVAATQVLSSYTAPTGEPQRALRVYAAASRHAAIVAGGGAAGTAVAGETFLRLWVGDEVARLASACVVPLAIAFGANAVTSVFWFSNERDGRPDRNAVVTVVWAAIGIVALVVLTPRLHLRGAAYARVIAHAATPLVVLWFERASSRHVPGLWWRVVAGVLPAAVVMAAGMRLAIGLAPQTWASLVAVCAGGVVLYASLVFVGPAVDADERTRLRAWMRRRLGAPDPLA